MKHGSVTAVAVVILAILSNGVVAREQKNKGGGAHLSRGTTAASPQNWARNGQHNGYSRKRNSWYSGNGWGHGGDDDDGIKNWGDDDDDNTSNDDDCDDGGKRRKATQPPTPAPKPSPGGCAGPAGSLVSIFNGEIQFQNISCPSISPHCFYLSPKGFRGIANGTWVCRTVHNPVTGVPTKLTSCIDPELSLSTDVCGCCGTCPTPCTCPCGRGKSNVLLEMIDATTNITRHKCVPAEVAVSIVTSKSGYSCVTSCSSAGPTPAPSKSTKKPSTSASPSAVVPS